MKRYLLFIALLVSLGCQRKTNCNTALNITTALGSIASFVYWTEKIPSYIQHFGIKSVLRSTLIPRLALDALTTGNMIYSIIDEEKNSTQTKEEENNKKMLLKTSMAISALGGVASFLFWLKPTITIIHKYGLSKPVAAIYLARLAIDIVTIMAAGKYILEK